MIKGLSRSKNLRTLEKVKLKKKNFSKNTNTIAALIMFKINEHFPKNETGGDDKIYRQKTHYNAITKNKGREAA